MSRAKVYQLSIKTRNCFAGMFNGCKGKGVIFKPETDALSIGKAECEWNWRDTWGELKSHGLIDWQEEDVPCLDGSKMKYVHLQITEKGHDWRDEDLRLYRIETQRLEAEEADQLHLTQSGGE